MIELYRAIIPSNKIINDNHGQHYRIIQNSLEWLTEQFSWTKDGYYLKTIGRGRGAHKEKIEYKTPFGFKMPSLKEVKKYMYDNNKNDNSEDSIISIRCEVWKPRNLRFDPQNYAHTFKAAIDMLTKYEYIIDDNWKFVNGITYVGGGPDVWNKRLAKDDIFTFNNEHLPEELTPDIWKSECSEDYNDILIRILVERN